jgi:hypothetical protein
MTRQGLPGRIRRWTFCIAVVVLAAVCAPAHAAPVTSHPRLWLRQGDLQRLRSWAVPANPVYAQGLRPLALSYAEKMDDGSLLAGDAGANYGYTPYPVEWAAELFAFMSLVEPDAAVRDAYAARARTLLMHVIDLAALGPIPEDRDWRWEHFSTDMRSLFYGEAFPLVADWIADRLSADDKAKIRQVFLRWQAENLVATTSGYDHPEPPWTLDDPALLADRERFRAAGNNFFLAHMNQIGLMALAFDAADDPGDPAVAGDQVRDYLADAIGAWLFMHHRFSEELAAGGVPPEGMMYGPTGIGRAAEFLLALQTAGEDDTAAWGPQVSFTTPFWNSVVPALLHSTAPAPVVLEPWKGPVYHVADHGDAYEIYHGSAMTLLGPLGLHGRYTGAAQRLNDARWLETHLAPGGADRLVERAGDWNYVRDCILHFLLFDPAAPPPADPRPALATSLLAPGMNRILARTAWGDPEASWFTYILGWNSIDHQHATGNAIGFWRKGEWLTKPWAGYGMFVGNADYQNTLALRNAGGATGVDFWAENNRRGSQYLYGPGDPLPLASSLADGYTYALGDATALYNNAAIGASAVTEATRSVLWVKPDTIVVYDRAATADAGLFKRFWLNLPAAPALAGARATAATASGRQRIVVDTLLPDGAAPAVDLSVPDGAGYVETASYEPMVARLFVAAPGAPARTAFLHVIQGVDAGLPALAAGALASSAGTPFTGAVVGDVAVLFPVSLGADRAAVPAAGAPFAGVTYRVPQAVTRHFVTGLAPGAGYAVTERPVGDETEIVIAPGGGAHVADAGGVLALGAAAPPPGTLSLESVAAQDGWVRESSRTSSRGGRLDAAGATITVGDDALGRQLRGVLSFDVPALPAGATLVGATLRVRQGRMAGKPYARLGALTVDLIGGAFAGAAALESRDFQARAGLAAAARFAPPAADGWLAADVGAAALGILAGPGTVQARVRFSRGDNGNSRADQVGFGSGEAAPQDRPVLVLRYTVPSPAAAAR